MKNPKPVLDKLYSIMNIYETLRSNLLPDLPQVDYSWDVEGRYFNKKANLPTRLKKHKNYTSNNKYLFCSKYDILLNYTNILYIQIHLFQKRIKHHDNKHKKSNC